MTQTLTANPFTAIAGDRHAAYAALAVNGLAVRVWVMTSFLRTARVARIGNHYR